MRTLLLLAFALCFHPLPANAQGFGDPGNNPELRSAVDYSEVISALTEEIERGMRKERVPGLAIILIDGDEIVWRQGFGEAEYRSKRPMTPELRIQGSDFTKVITAMAVLKLVEQGRIDLDAPVTQYAQIDLHPVKPEFAVPTVRQLLAHQSGLPLNYTAGMFQDQMSTHTQGWQAIQPLQLGQPAGVSYNYSNLGYVVLAEMLSQIQGQSWERSVADLVLAPLAMAEAIAAPDPDTLVSGHEERKKQEHWWPRENSALGLTFSLDEVARVAQLILNRGSLGSVHLLSPEMIELMLAPQQPPSPFDLDNRYGFSWQLTNTVNPGVSHIARVTLSGSFVRGGVLLAPEDRLGVVLFANSDESGEIARALTSQALNRMLEAKSGIPMPKEDDDALPEHLALPDGVEADAMASAYAGPLGLMRFEGEPLHYRVDFYGRIFHAKLRSDGWYRIRYRLLGFVPLSFGILDKLLMRPVILEGKRVLLISYVGRYFLAGTQYQPEPPGPPWSERQGEYELVNPDRITELAELEDVRVVIREGFLLAQWRLPTFLKMEMSIPLAPLDDQRLLTVGSGSGMGLVATFSEVDGATEIEVSGYRFRRKP